MKALSLVFESSLYVYKILDSALIHLQRSLIELESSQIQLKG